MRRRGLPTVRISGTALVLSVTLAFFGRPAWARPPRPLTEVSQEEPAPDVPPAKAKGSAPRPAPPPDGILPVGELARIDYGPRDRPRVAIENGRLIVVTTSGEIAGYDVATGEFSWKLGLPGETLFEPVAVQGEAKSTLVATRSGTLLFLDETNGAILRETSAPTEIALAPVVALPLLYLGTPSGAVVALDIETGTERFRVETGEPPRALALGAGLLVVSGGERTLTAIDAADGQRRWVLRARAGFFAPAVFDEKEDKLYIGDDAGELYCLEARSGKRCFRWSTGASIRTPVLVEEKRIYVTSYGNNLYCYQAGGGAEQWRTSIPGRPASGAVRIHNRLLIATLDGVLIEVNPEQGVLGKSFGAPGELATPPAFFVARPSLKERAAEKERAEQEAGSETEREESPDALEGTGTVRDAQAAPYAPESAPGGETEEPVAEAEPGGDLKAQPSAPATPPGPPPWYAAHRIALSLRTGEVLLLSHKAPEPKPETEAKPGGEAPPETGAEPTSKGQTVPKKGTRGPANR